MIEMKTPVGREASEELAYVRDLAESAREEDDSWAVWREGGETE